MGAEQGLGVGRTASVHAGPTPLVVVRGDPTEQPPPQLTPRGPFEIGQRIAGGYEITGVIGAGGMGVVYDAVDRSLGRRVAIKTPALPVFSDALRAEGRALAALRGDSFVAVHALLEHEGTACLVMERLFGETLDARIEDRRARAQPFTIAEVVDLLVPIARALSAMHLAGLSQRDVKPANLFQCGARVVLFDMGIAVPEALVEPGALPAGSLQYLAPEVILRTVERGLGPMVDLYSLGALAFELLTGRPPYRCATLTGTLTGHVGAPIPDVQRLRPDVPCDLAALVTELLAKDPLARPPSAEAVLWQLEEIRSRAVGRSFRQIRVLAIDDEADVGRALKSSLESAFPRLLVDTSTDPSQAMKVGAVSPDVVLVDLNMPEHNGVEVCMHLASLPASRRPLVVAMSSQASEADVAVLRLLGVRDFVVKDQFFVSSMSNVIARLRDPSTLPSLPPPSSRPRGGG